MGRSRLHRRRTARDFGRSWVSRSGKKKAAGLTTGRPVRPFPHAGAARFRKWAYLLAPLPDPPPLPPLPDDPPPFPDPPGLGELPAPEGLLPDAPMPELLPDVPLLIPVLVE